jgi:hypothetical protein
MSDIVKNMSIVIVTSSLSIARVTEMAKQQFGNFIKATVDAEKGVMALGGDLHADEEEALLEQGSQQKNLWGINLYPAKFNQPDFIEFDSMINLRPSQDNVSSGVEDEAVRTQITEIIAKLVKKDGST